jgi:YD repeat-containing protein
VYGKVDRVYKANGAEVTYLYDAAGQRVAKTVGGVTTHYVRDASGNDWPSA